MKRIIPAMPCGAIRCAGSLSLFAQEISSSALEYERRANPAGYETVTGGPLPSGNCKHCLSK